MVILKRFMPILAIVVIASFFVGCAGMAPNLTMKERNYEARKWLNDSFEVFLNTYRFSSETTQDRWDQEIVPLFDSAYDAINAWDATLAVGGSDAVDKEATFKQIKATIIYFLINEGIIEIKEE